MVALGVEEQKAFTAGLSSGIFDKFLVQEAEIVTYNQFTIDGRSVRAIFRRGTGKQDRKYSSWKT
ncbi:MAG: DUF5721 family protein [Clostridium sp.]